MALEKSALWNSFLSGEEKKHMQDDRRDVPVPQNSLCAENDNNVFPVQVLSQVRGLLHRRGLMQRLPGPQERYFVSSDDFLQKS